ncbi:Molybdopterin dinucleotide binding domain protein [Desulfamplus magnetovallimortis]|uniref:Molybdopterin dinucleotide binding domain protein n=1 Tax=Desulfamplus magnetovallimortis TaxID=1246637 RepID=A0A1W1HF68_9BACT|nr:molybdopterin-dependent oxidoreductase [Desulfamplus magnetovallimortis]SLM31022.1 Molybdopterin dinucleotide binding domain protein [Desulfamplus magnetovallimortis]
MEVANSDMHLSIMGAYEVALDKWIQGRENMGEWHKTGCVLCAQNCGLEILVENNRMVKVKPDKSNPRSQGYACRKGLNVIHHQYPKDRITEPLKRVGDRFEEVSWEQAIDEITSKMKDIVDKHGPRSLAYMGASSQGGHLEGAFGLSILRALGSQYFYNSGGQEFSSSWWLFGRMLGKQYNIATPDEAHSEMLVGWGWNGMESHQMPRAPIVLREFSQNPDKILVIIDPRKSETARIANIHLPIRPGSDALLIKAMISIIIENKWEKREYIETHVDGWDTIRPWFENFDAREAIGLCGLEYDQVIELCQLMTTKKWCLHPDLGIYMGRNSVMNSYMMNILGAICGIFCVPGGNVIPGMVVPMGYHADERNPKTWKTVITGMPPASAGSFPPAVMPEEILNDHPDRLRAVYVSACNPLRSYPDTQAYEKAFSKLDLLVVNDIVMSETARFAHYVLPCRTYYESWDATFFPWTFPKVFFQLRRPIVSPPEKCLEASQIFTLMAERLGLIPDIPDEVAASAKQNRLTFAAKLMEWAANTPDSLRAMPFVLARSLGKEWDSAALAGLWGVLMTAPKTFRKNAARIGFEPGIDQGDRIFQALLDTPQGIWIGEVDPNENFKAVKTPSGKIDVYVPELEEDAIKLNAQSETQELKMSDEFPFILNAGRHTRYNINTMIRGQEWNKGKRACTICVNPEDANSLGISEGEIVKVLTEAGSEVGELEVSYDVRIGTVLIPHGFGLIYDGTIYGLNVNKLTKNANRDQLGTPMHRFVPCRLEAVNTP